MRLKRLMHDVVMKSVANMPFKGDGRILPVICLRGRIGNSGKLLWRAKGMFVEMLLLVEFVNDTARVLGDHAGLHDIFSSSLA